MVLAKGGMAYVEEQGQRARAAQALRRTDRDVVHRAFLVSPRSDFMTGQVISPNGGETIVGF